MIDGRKGSQQVSDFNGNAKRPIDPKITGHYNYDARLIIEKIKGE